MKKVKGKRIAAAIIDKIITFITAFVLSGIIVPIIKNIIFRTNVKIRHINDIFVILFFYIIYLLIIFINYTIIPKLTKGKTIGKAIFKIKIISTNYQSPTFYQYFTRNIFFYKVLFIYIFPTLYLIISKKINFYHYYSIFNSAQFLIIFIGIIISNIIDIIIFFMIILTDEERGFHDLIGRTYVIDKNFSTNPLDNINPLEMEQMDWAMFSDTNINTTENKDNTNEDEIEILKRIK